ncbi:hypothetical protein GIB67_035397, partial [Kingdonia uniflora]
MTAILESITIPGCSAFRSTKTLPSLMMASSVSSISSTRKFGRLSEFSSLKLQLRYQRSAVASTVSKKMRVIHRGDGVVCETQETALEDSCLKEHEEGKSSSDWRGSEIEDQETPCHGFDELYGNYCELMLFFDRRYYGCRAMMLEMVAVVQGMLGGMLLHCKSLRRFEHSRGWIKALLEEAENERMHLMTFMEVAKPRWYERAFVITVQGKFFNAYFLAYLASPKLAHRIVGYLEEEAIHSYSEFLKEIDKGKIENVLAPAIAIDYWRLPADSTLRDVVMVVRADEAHHCDVNHFASIRKLEYEDLCLLINGYTMNEKVPLTASNRRKRELAREGDLITYKRKRMTIDPSTVVPPNTVDTANEGVSEPVPTTDSAQAALAAQPPLSNVFSDSYVNILIVGEYSEDEGASSNGDIGSSDKSLLRSFRFHRVRSITLGQEKLPIRVHHHQSMWDLSKEPQVVQYFVKLKGLHRIGAISYNYYNSALISTFAKRWQPKTNSFHFKWGEMTPTLDDVDQLVGLHADGDATVIGGTWGFPAILKVFENSLLQDLNAFKSLNAGGVEETKIRLCIQVGEDDDVGIHQWKETSVNEYGDTPVHQFEDVAEQYDASPQTSECDQLKETIEQMKEDIELKRIVDEQCALEFADLLRYWSAKIWRKKIQVW